jgi:hypothetical protein
MAEYPSTAKPGQASLRGTGRDSAILAAPLTDTGVELSVLVPLPSSWIWRLFVVEPACKQSEGPRFTAQGAWTACQRTSWVIH